MGVGGARKGEKGEKLYFFTIIADILFGYCVLCGRSARELEPESGMANTPSSIKMIWCK